jgi:predicted glutamine amidotransferase
MCRLLLVSGKIAYPEISLALSDFRKLAEYGKIPQGSKKGHPDGWGIVAYSEQQRIRFRKSHLSAAADPKFSQAARSLKGKNADIILGHLRKASVGGINKRNAQPFVWNNFSFGHNGTVFVGNRMDLKTRFSRSVKGTTDSEKLFAYMLQNLNEKKNAKPSSVTAALKKTIRNIRENFDYTAMNFILSDGKYSWALREVNEKNEEVKKKKMMDYYSLFIGKNKNYKIVSSEKISLKKVKWKALKNHKLLQV